MMSPSSLVRLVLAIGALHITPGILVADDNDDIKALRESAAKLVKESKLAEAATEYEKALALATKFQHPNSAAIANELANVYFAQGQFVKAEPVYLQSLSLFETQNGKESANVGTIANNLGRVYQQIGENEKSEKAYLRALKIREGNFGADNAASEVVVRNLGSLYKSMGRYAQAEAMYERSLKFCEAERGKDHPDTAAALQNLAATYGFHTEYAKAEPLLKRALEIRENKLGKDHLDTAVTVLDLAIIYSQLAEYAKSETMLQRALEIRESKLGKDHLLVADTLNYYVSLYLLSGRPEKAEPLCLRALQMNEAKVGKDHVRTAAILNQLIEVYRSMGLNEKGEAAGLRALAIRESKLGKDHIDTAATLNFLAVLYKEMGQYSKAESMLRRALLIQDAKLGADHRTTSAAMQNLALLFHSMGQYGKSEALYKRALAIREAKFGNDHPATGLVLQNLALLQRSMGQTAKAEASLQRALAIYEAKQGKDSSNTALIQQNLALMYVDSERYAEAEELFQKSLATFEDKLGKDHPKTALVLSNLGDLFLATNQPEKAEVMYRRALAINEKKLGMDHPNTAASKQRLANLYSNTNQFDKAEKPFQEAIGIFRARLGKDHPTTASALANLAVFYARSGRIGEAIRIMDRALRSMRIHTATVLPILSDQDQLAFLEKTYFKTLRRGLSLALGEGVGEENKLRTASWLLNSKAVAQESLSERLILARDNNTEEARKALTELQDLRREIAQLSLAESKTKQPSDAKRLEDLRDQVRKLEGSLISFDTRTQRDDRWFEPDELRQRLPDKSVFIDIARFEPRDFKLKGTDKKSTMPARYVAWVVGKTGEVQIVDLGLAEPIDAATKAVRKELEAAAKQIKAKGETAAEKELREPLLALSKLILHPLAKHIGDTEQWIVSPDANLWLVPWSILPTEDGKYAIEKHRIQYVVSGRDLIINPLKLDRKPSAPLILADPDFDLGLSAAELELKKLGRVEDNENRGLSKDFKLGAISRLPYTAAEAEAILPHLEKYTGTKANLFTDKQALVGLFKSIKNPRVVILSTHGFFLEEDRPAKKESAAADEVKSTGPAGENPLLRCGLLLAGCNNAAKAIVGSDNGVLTGLEIISTDLRGTELVVLSACETGLGDIQNGEGVAGLRQAFQLAGAESVVATLWQVPDLQSAQLMVRFFDNLANGQQRGEALRNAQLEMIKNRRNRNNAAHPFFWAAFTVTGQVK